MRPTIPRAQLVLEWRNDLHWDDLPNAMRQPVREVLRVIVRHAVDAGVAQEERGRDQ